MTAIDFEREHVQFVPSGGEVTIAGPRGRADLMTALRSEVERRVPELRELKPNPDAGYGVCETCGDPLLRYRGGMCSLCVIARRKALGPVELWRLH